METSKKIRNARLAAKMSQGELGARCNMHHTHISAYERGTRIPKLEAIAAIAKALDVSPISLLPDWFLELDKKITGNGKGL